MMNILCVFTACALFACAYGCTTQETITAVDNNVVGIALKLAQLQAITFDFTKGTAEVKLPVPELLDTMCTTEEIKQHLQEIQSHVSTCPQLLDESPGLQLLQIEGVDMTALFTDFDNIDAFCGCRVPVAAAWIIRAWKDHLQHENTAWFYNITADAEAVCSNEELHHALIQFGETSTECQTATEKQAELTTEEGKQRIHRLVKLAGAELCKNFSSEIWNCISETASGASFHFCLHWVENLTTDKHACGKRMCITTYIDGHCGNGAADLYIDAVNVEHPDEVADTHEVCVAYTDLTCVTFEALHKVNTAVETVSEHLHHYINDTDETFSIEKDSIPTVLNSMLCNETGLLPAMEEIETLTTQCRTLAQLSTSFGPLNIHGWEMQDIYKKFPSLAIFCNCTHGLVHAWNLREKEPTWQHTDQHAPFTKIANVRSICGIEQKAIIESIATSQEECKQVLEEEAGFSSSSDSTFSELHNLVNTCNSSIDVMSGWDCTTSIAASNEFATCITEAETGVGDRALCRKHQCVFMEMQGCGASARQLYIKAVNMENSNGIKESYEGCDGACGICFSLVVLIAGCCLSML